VCELISLMLRRPALTGPSEIFWRTSSPSTPSTPRSPWESGVCAVDLGDDPAQAYRDTIEPLLTAWKQPGALQRHLDSPAGRKPAEFALWVHLRETLVHGWDLAAATRQRACLDNAVIVASLVHARQLDPAPTARPAGLGFANAVDAPTGAQPIIQLAAFFGRDVSTWNWT